MAEHAVIVAVSGASISQDDATTAHDKFEAAFASASWGEYDGYEWATDGSEVTFYFYGPDAKEIFISIFPELAVTALTKTADVTLRFGEAGDPAARVQTIKVSDIPVSED